MQIGRFYVELHQYSVMTALGLQALSKYLHWGARTPKFVRFRPFSTNGYCCTRQKLSFDVNMSEIEKG